MDHYAMALTDITDIVRRHIDEGANPEDIITALEEVKFTLLMHKWKAAEAYSTLFLKKKAPEEDDLLRK
jgi:hypothetical protein